MAASYGPKRTLVLCEPVVKRGSEVADSLLHLLSAVPDLQAIGEHTRFHDLPDQTTVHRVAVPFHHDQAAGVHPCPHLLSGVQASVRQRTKPLHLFYEPWPAPTVE